jgi:hypothetical protein
MSVVERLRLQLQTARAQLEVVTADRDWIFELYEAERERTGGRFDG